MSKSSELFDGRLFNDQPGVFKTAVTAVYEETVTELKPATERCQKKKIVDENDNFNLVLSLHG